MRDGPKCAQNSRTQQVVGAWVEATFDSDWNIFGLQVSGQLRCVLVLAQQNGALDAPIDWVDFTNDLSDTKMLRRKIRILDNWDRMPAGETSAMSDRRGDTVFVPSECPFLKCLLK